MSRGPCPFESPDCKYFDSPTGCFSDTHHLQYPRADYRSKLEKQFRELPENKVDICRDMHDECHAFEDLPLKPSLEVMRHTVNESRIQRLIVEGVKHGIA